MKKIINDIVRRALAEDIGKGDLTTSVIIPPTTKSCALIISKQDAVLCGLEIVRHVFKRLDRNIHFESKFKDGDRIKAYERIIRIKGMARAILAGERTALNFLSHLSGIATLTSDFVEKVKSYNVQILDTRKTTPGLRVLEKFAIRCGGGSNHRLGLWDMVLIKDNHKKILSIQAKKTSKKFTFEQIIKKAKQTKKKVEIEVENLSEFKEALLLNPDIIMLDNMSLREIRKAVNLRRRKRPLIEVSGNVDLSKLKSIAGTGADMISSGTLTHSSKAVDFSLKII